MGLKFLLMGLIISIYKAHLNETNIKVNVYTIQYSFYDFAVMVLFCYLVTNNVQCLIIKQNFIKKAKIF